MDVRHSGSTIHLGATGDLDEEAEEVLQRALENCTGHERDLLVDLRGIATMDADGLFHLLELHRRAESLDLRVLVTGWQAQPQQLMATVAGIPGPGTAMGERYALAGFRHLLADRTQRTRDHADFAAGWLPRV
ncbi:STAS domain-containing protein [Streptomyces sp. NPDC048606]|uniref:STAS domain-containing protein n=1 Tax=Streptomyces sp. NPDC048606 TaxID=3154726 RepID=UPI0034493DDA